MHLHAGTHERGFRLQEGHRLPLHVGAHQRPVGIVVLKKRNQRCRHRNDLPRRDVDVIDRLTGSEEEVSTLPAIHNLALEAATGRPGRAGLGNGMAPLVKRGHELDFVRDPAAFHLPVRGFDESVPG